MTSPTPCRATDGQQAGGQSRDLPQRIDQSMFWRDVRQAVLFVVTFVVIGGVSVVFLTLPRHEQAMWIYGAVLIGSVSMIVASLRRKHGR